MKNAVIAALVFVWVAAASADVIVEYNFDGSLLIPSNTHAHITAGNFSYTGGGTPVFVAGNPGLSYSSAAWSNNLNLYNYYAFDVTVDPGWYLNVTNLGFDSARSGTGPTNWLARYSTDGTTFNDIETLTFADQSVVWITNSADAVQPAGLTGINYFRIYGRQTEGSVGTFRLDDVTLYGNVVPEPAALMLVGVGLGVLTLLRRRYRS